MPVSASDVYTTFCKRDGETGVGGWEFGVEEAVDYKREAQRKFWGVMCLFYVLSKVPPKKKVDFTVCR